MKQEPEKLAEMYPPKSGAPVAVGDVFTSCNWVIRDGYVVFTLTLGISSPHGVQCTKNGSEEDILDYESGRPPSI